MTELACECGFDMPTCRYALLGKMNDKGKYKHSVEGPLSLEPPHSLDFVNLFINLIIHSLSTQFLIPLS